MDELTSILSAYEQVQSRRALGGIYALTGFDYQLRCYLAEFAESLAGEGQGLDEAGGLFLEALSDLAKQTEGGRLVCIQVKRTLTKETLKDAAAEVEAIDCFLRKHHPSLRDLVKFELVASKGDVALQWREIPEKHAARSIIDTLLQEDRLLPPRIEPDPWWRAIAAVWKHLKDPYGFLRFALDRALTRAPTAADAQRIRDDICERFAQARQMHERSGQLLTSADFQCVVHPSPSLEIGREITLARLRDQQYMARAHRLDALYATLLKCKDLSQRDLKSEARVFWLSGRSGVGKSVLLLQTVERLVGEGWRVLWLKGQAELLEPALRAIIGTPSEWWPDFIAIDDLYDRDARERLDLARLGEFIDERGHQAWPMILTCGPAEFAESFKEDSAFGGFEVHRETVETIAASEAAEIEAWYCVRTGQVPNRGAAFSQASKDDEGLFVSLAVELAHGDLQAFAKRFAERVRLNGLEEALRLPLAMNRLYLRAPYDWLTEDDREKLATLNGEGDFSLLDADNESQIVRLTHPHLADALYRSLRKPANADAFTNDLIAIFRRALADRNTGLVLQLLRVFSARGEALTSERLTGRKDRAEWNYIWQDLLAQSKSLPEDIPLGELLRLGREWLTGREDRTEWTYIWRELLAQSKSESEDMPLGELLRLGREWLTGREDRTEWVFIWEELLAQSKSPPHDMQLGELLCLGAGWLAGRENTKEWGFVCEAMLDQRFQSSDFIAQVATWLESTKAKPEWPLLAAKFIAIAPHHAASADFSVNLTERINACPNNGHWFKTVNIMSNLTAGIVLPPAVRDWLQALYSRKESPAWGEAFRCLDDCLPIKGKVIAVKKNYCSVELEVGLVAVLPNRHDGFRRAKGFEGYFYVSSLNLDRDFVQVCLESPASLISKKVEGLTVGGTYEGYVTGVKDFGVFVRVNGHSGLLHRSKLPLNTVVMAHFPLGNLIRVQISNFRSDGKLELSLPID
ncbi:S1 RNA-binding domain-containing protein [Pseudomonas asiatica]|uniref:P-loop NTPase n=1 Tax=Pseudomonas asiatica TaxID=2219225 RepID=UPI00399AF32C